MKRPKPGDFKVEYTKGIAEIASVRKQYSKAQDLYIDHLEQLLIHSVVKPSCGWTCEKCGETVNGIEVTYEETHEGCGGKCI